MSGCELIPRVLVGGASRAVATIVLVGGASRAVA